MSQLNSAASVVRSNLNLGGDGFGYTSEQSCSIMFIKFSGQSPFCDSRWSSEFFTATPSTGTLAALMWAPDESVGAAESCGPRTGLSPMMAFPMGISLGLFGDDDFDLPSKISAFFLPISLHFSSSSTIPWTIATCSGVHPSPSGRGTSFIGGMGGRVGLPGFLFFGAGNWIVTSLFGMPLFGTWALGCDVVRDLSFSWMEVALDRFSLCVSEEVRICCG